MNFARLAATALVAATAGLPATTAAQDAARVIAVTGSAETSVAPDRATLQLTVSARDREIEAARAEVAATTRRFLDFADSEDIDEKDIQTTGLNIHPQFRWNRDDEVQELTGYMVERHIVVRLEAIDKIGGVLEGAVTAGVNQVQPPALERSDERDLKREVLARAAVDARANAEAIARAMDATLGELHSLNATELRGYPEPRMQANRMATAADAESVAASTYFVGEITITATVEAQFAIADDE